jgi:hypothetical protein
MAALPSIQRNILVLWANVEPKSVEYNQIDEMRKGNEKLHITKVKSTHEALHYTLDVPPCSFSTCSTSNTGSRNALLHFGQTSIVTRP